MDQPLPFEFGKVRPPPKHPPAPQMFAPSAPQYHQAPRGGGRGGYNNFSHRGNYHGQRGGNFHRGNRGGNRFFRPGTRGGHPQNRQVNQGDFQRHANMQQYRSAETHSDDEDRFEGPGGPQAVFYFKNSFVEDPWAPIFDKLGIPDPYPASVFGGSPAAPRSQQTVHHTAPLATTSTSDPFEITINENEESDVPQPAEPVHTQHDTSKTADNSQSEKDRLMSLKVSELKHILTSKGLKFDDLHEKAELVTRILSS